MVAANRERPWTVMNSIADATAAVTPMGREMRPNTAARTSSASHAIGRGAGMSANATPTASAIGATKSRPTATSVSRRDDRVRLDSPGGRSAAG
jgi:hypothetical protein